MSTSSNGASPEYWLAVLQRGPDSQKIEARRYLAGHFEASGRLADATELLEGNITAGARDVETYRRLASLYRRLNRQDLADRAMGEALRLGGSAGAGQNPSAFMHTGLTDTRVTPPPPSTSPFGQSPFPPAFGKQDQTAWDSGPVPPPVAPPWRRPRPVWLMMALCIATFGLYTPYWFYATWRELKLELRDDTMRPVWHAVFASIFAWLFRPHAQKIVLLAEQQGMQVSLRPTLAMILYWVLSWISLRLSWNDNLPLGLDLFFDVCIGAIFAWSQDTLNQVWQALPGGAARFRVHWGEWTALALGGIMWALVVLGSAV